MTDWEAVLKKEGLGMDRGKPNWLAYGHEYRDRINYEVRAHSTTLAPKKKRLKPAAKIRLLVRGEVLPQEPQHPDWGYAGGYSSEGKRVRVSPGHHKARESKERELCSKIAVKSRANKSVR